MNAQTSSVEPAAAQQLIARYVALIEQHTDENAFPAPATTLPASKTAIKSAVRTVLAALAATSQLTAELTAFLEDAFVTLANYVDDELAALAAEHRRASAALETAPREPRERLASPNWEIVARTSRLAGEIARRSVDEAAELRQEFRSLLSECSSVSEASTRRAGSGTPYE